MDLFLLEWFYNLQLSQYHLTGAEEGIIMVDWTGQRNIDNFVQINSKFNTQFNLILLSMHLRTKHLYAKLLTTFWALFCIFP